MQALEHIYTIKNLLSNGPSSQDIRVSDRFILHLLNTTRALLLTQQLQRFNTLTDQNYATICLELEPATTDICCNDITDNCILLKSKKKLPKRITTSWGDTLRVTDAEGVEIPNLSIRRFKYNKFASAPSEYGWYEQNGYLYLLNNTFLESVVVSGLWYDITEIVSPCGEQENCPNEFEYEYPLDPRFLEALYKMTIQTILMTKQIPQDEENDRRSVI
jgi:hypothetical protein